MNHRGNAIPIMVVIALLLCPVAVYWPVGGFEFTNFDDPQYVTGNDFVNTGLTGENLRRAFTGAHSSNWHPLTWISHMVDVEIFGLRAGGHHVTNLVIHAVNGAILFLVLRLMTGAVWRSATVAMLFAVHPLHVESVAWISERKDVLSGFFFLLTLWFYTLYSRVTEKRAGFYLAALGFFACGLMSKPMVVTTPFVLLLLDVWPLGRTRVAGAREWWNSVFLREKVPFFLLSVVSCVVTFIAQRNEGAVRGISEFSLWHRFANAACAYLVYLRKTVWPSDLAVFYPHHSISIAVAVAAILLLVAVTVIVGKVAKRRPYMLLGWLWFLGTLVPVIGIVQVGEQALADRYTYFPLIGIFIAVCWGCAELVTRLSFPRWLVRVGIAGVCFVFGVVAFGQVQTWRNTEAVFTHALRVTKGNYLAMNNLSTELLQQGRFAEAEPLLVEAVRLRPQFHDAQLSLGNVYAHQGRWPEAEKHFLAAIQILPDSQPAHFNLGNVLKTQQRFEEAFAAYSVAVRLDPQHADARSNLALLLARAGRMQEAARHYAAVVEFLPENAEAHYNLGMALVNLEQFEAAEEQYRASLLARPEFSQAHWQLARLLIRRGERVEGRAHLVEALRIDPAFAEAQQELVLLGE